MNFCLGNYGLCRGSCDVTRPSWAVSGVRFRGFGAVATAFDRCGRGVDRAGSRAGHVSYVVPDFPGEMPGLHDAVVASGRPVRETTR